MKKIIVAVDGLRYSQSASKYAIHLASMTSAYLVGVFLDDFTYHSYNILDLVGEEGFVEEKITNADQKDKEYREEAAEAFASACKREDVEFTIHHDRSVAMQELLHESIYADLLVIDRKETLTHYDDQKHPTPFIHELLSEVQCPVLIVPSEFKPIDHLVLLYDGEPSSVYAIRTFNYILPELKWLPTEVLTVNNAKQSVYVPDNMLMKEFMKRHFSKAKYTTKKGDAETQIVSHLQSQNNSPLIVLGAYKRGIVSRWFRPSMADHLMRELDMPLFIAHNK